MIKEYFTDGLLQIAIVLSLLRTDLDSYVGISYNRNQISPELRETFLGSLSGYIQTDVHIRNRWNAAGLSGYVHSKSIDSIYPESIFRELHSLSHYRNFDGVETSLNTWLVNGPEPSVPHGQRSSVEATNPVDGHVAGSGEAGVPDENELEGEGAVGSIDFASYFGSDLTKEDMDLIEVLWRQDIDLGVGKEMYDVNLRQELEKEAELEQIKQEEVKKEKQNDPEGQSDSFPLLDLSGNYVIDGETGELVPGPPLLESEPSSPLSLSDLHNLMPQNSLALVSIPSVADTVQSYGNAPSLGLLNNSVTMFQPGTIFDESVQDQMFINSIQDFNIDVLAHQSGLGRQNSLEERWQEVLGLLNLPDPSLNSTPFELDLPVPTEPLVQNVSFGEGMNYTEPLLPSQSYALDSQSSFSLFMDSGMNDLTYLPDSTSMSVLDLPSPTVPFSILDASLVNTGTSSSSYPMAIDGGQLSSEAENVTDLSLPAVESLFNLLDNGTIIDNNLNLNDIDFDFDPVDLPGFDHAHQTNDDVSSDSAFSSVTSPTQWCQDVVGQTGGADEAVGGKQDISTSEMDYDKYPYEQSTRFQLSSPFFETNSSCSSNDTDFQSSKEAARQVFHNHTYMLQPGQVSKEEKEAAIKLEKEQKATRCRDEKKAKEMKLPFSIDEIINTPVEEFTQMMSRYSLSERQNQLIRDIRRRGKNKQAAQNCRKRKLDVIQTLEEEISGLHQERSSLVQARRHLDRETAQLKDKFVRLQTELFRSLRDDNGRPYNPNEYTLQQLPDGNMFLVPKNNTVGAAPEQTHVEKPGRKRKPKRKE